MDAVVPDTREHMARARLKQTALVRWLQEARSVLVGFSGGVDSAFLACVAVEVLGESNVLAVVGRSSSYPESQWDVARHIATQFAIPLHEVSTEELADPRYAANPANRCYFCKSVLWELLTPIATARGLARVVDGSNADDLTDFRPGALAASERGVRSPLADVGLMKSEIRSLSRIRGLSTWDQPSSPCLSHTVPYGGHCRALAPDRVGRGGTTRVRGSRRPPRALPR
jgi:pyridinium-3,5-biscarboxylic acid mononucleotide sulfurtransferase